MKFNINNYYLIIQNYNYVSICIICSPNFEKLSAENPVENNQLGFSTAEKHLGISSLLNPAEMGSPDRLALVTYLSLFYELFHESQPVTIPTATEHDLKAKKPTTSEKSTVSMKESATGEVTSIKKPATTEKHVTVTSTKKVKSTDDSFTSSQKPLNSSEKPVNFGKKPVSIAASSTSSQKSITTSEKQVASSRKPFAPSEKKVSSAEKPISVENISPVSAGKQISSAEKRASTSTSTNKRVATTEKPGTPAETLVEKQVTSADKCTASTENEQVEPSPKKKSKKKKFRLFSRRKKSLATATPSIER